jgi:hypothetical protein
MMYMQTMELTPQEATKKVIKRKQTQSMTRISAVKSMAQTLGDILKNHDGSNELEEQLKNKKDRIEQYKTSKKLAKSQKSYNMFRLIVFAGYLVYFFAILYQFVSRYLIIPVQMDYSYLFDLEITLETRMG